jgi:hypothetical protein
MSGLAEYILAKKTWADLDVCPFGGSQMTSVELADDRLYDYLGRPTRTVVTNLIEEVSLFNLLGTTYPASFVSDFSGEIIAISTTQSDSQQVARREQIARDAKVLNMQAKEHAARVFPFEKPFPREEPSQRVGVRDVSGVRKLRKRT